MCTHSLSWVSVHNSISGIKPVRAFKCLEFLFFPNFSIKFLLHPKLVSGNELLRDGRQCYPDTLDLRSLSLLKKKNSLKRHLGLLLYAYGCFACMHASVPHVCLKPNEVRRGCWVPWNQSYRRATRWVLGIESRYFHKSKYSYSLNQLFIPDILKFTCDCE